VNESQIRKPSELSGGGGQSDDESEKNILIPFESSNQQNGSGKNGGSQETLQRIRQLEIYYDSNRITFWAKNNRDGWIRIQTTDVSRWLAGLGFNPKRETPQKNSEIDEAITLIQKINDVDYADSLAGYNKGLYEIGGKRILVRDSPQLISPQPGKFPLIDGIILKMLGPEQRDYLFGWLKIAIEALYSGNLRVGQALTLAGPKDCGKSLFQNLLTYIFGNRCAKPHRYMSGGTDFNGDLFGCEHLIIEDEQASADIRARRNFGTRIKEITANQFHSCHAKFRPAITLNPFWRLSISVNDEPENLMILPPVDESLQDKLIILKAAKSAMPMPSATDNQRVTFMTALVEELPFFIDFLFKWQIPPELVSQRYGITHYHHPEILEALGTLSPETRLLEMVDAELFSSPAPGSWEGSASELERLLTKDSSTVAREARQLLSFPTACGTYLGRLQRLCPERFESDHTRAGNRWTIHPQPV
jgi:hypothetical protein